MVQDIARAEHLKAEGNKCFGQKDYQGAEGLYSKAILADSRNPVLYTNRAMACLKLGLYDSVITDCKTCLEYGDKNIKALYFLSQAQWHQSAWDEALETAREAYALCVETNDRNMDPVRNHILACRTSRWAAREKQRRREQTALEGNVVALLRQQADDQCNECDSDLDRAQILQECEDQIALLHTTFERAKGTDYQERKVPDWGVDGISFNFMIDPVVTNTGKSYERASIMQHLRKHKTDPLTREPLYEKDLRPNLELRQACEEFMEANEWVADW